VRVPSAQASPPPPPPTWHLLPELDASTLASWRATLPQASLNEIYTGFLRQTSERLSLLPQAGPEALGQHLHAIAGSAGMIGATRLEALCRDLRAQVRAGTPSQRFPALLGETFAGLAEVLRAEHLVA
jgi:HPt (histidine-containing phosphotransfer) domain-containing protein